MTDEKRMNGTLIGIKRGKTKDGKGFLTLKVIPSGKNMENTFRFFNDSQEIVEETFESLKRNFIDEEIAFSYVEKKVGEFTYKNIIEFKGEFRTASELKQRVKAKKAEKQERKKIEPELKVVEETVVAADDDSDQSQGNTSSTVETKVVPTKDIQLTEPRVSITSRIEKTIQVEEYSPIKVIAGITMRYDDQKSPEEAAKILKQLGEKVSEEIDIRTKYIFAD